MFSTILWLVSFICGIIIIISAFKSAIWKGILCLFTCGIYLLYYAIVEFEHEKKWLIVLGWLLPTILGFIARLMNY